MTSELTPGARYGEYELLAFIGRGGMAVVWSARRVTTGKVVALKTLLPQFASDPVLQERLMREGESQKTLDHPNILRADGAFRIDGTIFVVMDLVDGESLERYLLRRPNTPIPEVRGIAQAVLSALQFAHEANIVHRDVKPSNILLSRQGRILLSDFGIALLRNASRLTRMGGIGTPSYMSPEQIIGKDIGPLSDIYSFGCVLYELLTGMPPFHAEGPNAADQVRDWHQFRLPEPLLAKRPEIPPALAAAVMKALEKKASMRFQSCAEFAAALGVSIIGKAAAAYAGMSTPDMTAPLPGIVAQPRPSGNSPHVHGPGSSAGSVVKSASRPSNPSRPSSPVSERVKMPASTSAPVSDRVKMSTGAPAGRSFSTGGKSTPVATVVNKRPGFFGLIAIAGGILLAAAALVRWESGRNPAPVQPAAVASVQTPKSDAAAPPAGATGTRPASAQATQTQETSATAASPADGAGSGLSSVENTLRQLGKEYQQRSQTQDPQPESAQVAIPTMPASLSSGVLQWSGARGTTVEIKGNRVNSGSLTGDPIPSASVRLWVEGADGSVAQSPSIMDASHPISLLMPDDRTRIHWQRASTGPPR